MKRLSFAAVLVLTLNGLACAGSDRATAGNLHQDLLTIATPAEPDALLPPFVQTTQGKQAADLLFDHLAQPGTTLETVGDASFRPQLASSWSWAPDSLSIAFRIDPRARWHDGTPVRARDVQFSFAVYTDTLLASPHAGEFEGIDSVTVRDSLTAVAWWTTRHPEQFFQIAYNLAVMPAHLLEAEPRASLATSAFASMPVGSGRYRFERWTPHRELVFAADTTNYLGRPSFSRVVWIVTADPVAANFSVLSGQADVLEQLRGDAFLEARASKNIKTYEYGSLDYAYLQFNLQHDVKGVGRLFADRAMRVALTAAIDRPAVVRNALDSIGAVALGPFTRADITADTAMRQITFDPARAAAVLDSLGWTMDTRDSLRHRNGRTLGFEVLVPSTSSTRGRVAVLLQEQFRRAGIKVSIAPVEPGVFYARLEKGEFDSALNMWRADPSPTSVKQVWGTPRGKSAGMNFGRYANASFDALVDSAAASFQPSVRRALMRRAHQTIVDDAPAVWLYEPRNFAAVNARIQPVGMRADAWWAAIPDWRTTTAAVASTAY